jgi:hypothetical protein
MFLLRSHAEHKSKWLILAILLVTAAAIQLPLALNHDAAWHFYTSFRFIAGDRIGRDIADMNPPMAMWLFAGPAALVVATGIDPALTFKLATLALCALCWVICSRSITNRRDLAHPSLALVVLGLALFVMPGYDFGQREHLAVALTLPYILFASGPVSDRSTRAAVLTGMLAAIGIGFKPYFLAVPLIVEAYFCYREKSFRRLWRAELLTMALMWCVYVAAVGIMAPDYYTRQVPAAMVGYGAYDVAWPILIERVAAVVGVPALWALLCGVTVRRPIKPPAQAVLAASLAFLIAALAQSKGWAYQVYPAASLLVVAGGLMLSQVRLSPRGIMSAMVLLAMACLVRPAAFALDGWRDNGTTARVSALTRLFENDAPPGGYVFAFITSPRDIFPAVLESRRRWANASGAMLYLPAYVDALSADSPPPDFAEIKAVSDAQNHATIRDLATKRPNVILVDSSNNRLGLEGRSFEYIDFFHRHYPQFSQVWRAYSERRPIGRFRVFVRQPST